MVKLSIIILNYNTYDLTSRCIDSFFSYYSKKISEKTFEVIVVDNNSMDSDHEFLKKYCKEKGITFIQSNENGGFGKGNNIGAKAASGKYLLTLNSDTQVKDNNLEEALQFLDNNPKIGILGGYIENTDISVQRSYGDFYTFPSVILFLFGSFGKDLGEKFFQKPKNSQYVDWVSGGFMIIRRQVFEKLQGFDEKIFMYLEDMELCFRAKKIGQEVYYFPRAKVLHAGHGSSSRSFAIINIYKGILYFFKKHRSKFEYNMVKLLLITKARILIMVGIITGSKYLKETYSQAIKF